MGRTLANIHTAMKISLGQTVRDEGMAEATHGSVTIISIHPLLYIYQEFLLKLA